MYRTVTVLGLGTLGGFLCKYLAEIESIKEPGKHIEGNGSNPVNNPGSNSVSG